MFYFILNIFALNRYITIGLSKIELNSLPNMIFFIFLKQQNGFIHLPTLIGFKAQRGYYRTQITAE